MKKLILIISVALYLVSCSDPESYGMTRAEFKQRYENETKELFKRHMRNAFKNALDGDKTKDEITEDSRKALSEELEDLTGITMEQWEQLDKNVKLIESENPELLETMTIKEILDYKQ